MSTPFIHRPLPQLLMRAREAMMATFRPVLNQHGVTVQQWRILRALDDHGEMEARQIADECCILSPSLTGILVRMEKSSLIRRDRSQDDQRRLLVSLTEEGAALVDQVRPLTEARYRELEQKMGVEKLNQLYGLLDELIDVGATLPAEASAEALIEE